MTEKQDNLPPQDAPPSDAEDTTDIPQDDLAEADLEDHFDQPDPQEPDEDDPESYELDRLDPQESDDVPLAPPDDLDDFPEVEVAVVPIGGGGLISGVSMALKSTNPDIRVIGVESSGAPAMKQSVAAGHCITLEEVNCVIDGLRVKRVGEHTRSVVSRFVEEIVTLPDEQIFEAVIWLMARAKLVAEAAAAAPVAALLGGLVQAAPGTKVVAVLSGGNLDVDRLRGLAWN